MSDDDCPSCGGTGWVRMPDMNNTRGIRKLRFALIKLLARGDMVLMNCIMVTPPDWAVGKRDLDTGALIVSCSFVTHDRPYDYVPGTRLLARTSDAD